MIYLSTWSICYGLPMPNVGPTDLNRLWRDKGYIPIKPKFFGGDSVLVSISQSTGIFRDPKCSTQQGAAMGIFWMGGFYQGTPAEFVMKEMSGMDEPKEVIFDGKAEFKDGKVVFKGRAVKPFSDVRQAVFMLVEEQLEQDDETEGWKYYPVLLEE